ncbi:MAG: prepilin-type N-terminal cleavage/methylation domain-containing protein [bacterium]
MKKGFTLTELMIVVVIIGILLAILLPQVTKMIDKSREDATKANLNSMKTVIAMYYGDKEEWPSGDLDGDNDPAGGMDGDDLARALVPNHLETIPYVIVRKGASTANKRSRAIYTNQMHFVCPVHGVNCQGGGGSCPEHGTITNEGGWWYNVGNHSLRVNSFATDTQKVVYSTYGLE